MDKVVRAISEGSNALLESPTGTGKTMCLLTSALAVLKKEWEWIDKKIWGAKDETIIPKIIYTSRTFA